MGIREWVADSVGYRFFGCPYAIHHDRIFQSLKEIIPSDFKNRNISDLGCGDGANSLRIKKIFEAKSIIGYERNPFLVEKARNRGLLTSRWDLNKEVPNGEMAVFSFAFHHIENNKKVSMLREVADKFDYIFLIEPMADLYHRLLDAGHVLSKEKWVEVFDKALERYDLHQRDNNLIVFFKKNNATNSLLTFL